MAIVKTDEGDGIYILPDSARCTLCGENPLFIIDLPDGCPEKKLPFDYTCRPEYCEYYTEQD